jgi:chloramphenicol O-acetyltransferase type A
MRTIELEGWHRKGHFDLYNRFEFPHVNICVQLDITDLWANRARSIASPTITLIYTVTKAANRVPELRQRIRGEQLVEHEIVHPLITILGENDLFGVVTLDYDPDFETFTKKAAERLAQTEGNATLDEFPHLDQGEESARDDLLSITILPWLAFTGFAITRKPAVDCLPLLAIGKVQAVGDRYLLPFYVNFHHALADGLHIARFVKYIEEEAQALAESFG